MGNDIETQGCEAPAGQLDRLIAEVRELGALYDDPERRGALRYHEWLRERLDAGSEQEGAHG